MLMMRERLILDERLSAAAELVPSGAVLLDVGTDHGYLPVKLLLDGKIPLAGASDINSAPLSKAVETAEKYGVADKMRFCLADGLRDIPSLDEYTAVSICGMGGELIARIVSDCDLLRDKKIPLILQPMTSAEELSRFLAGAGYEICDERIALAAGKLYRVMLARYDGEARELSHAEHIIGARSIERGREQKNFEEYLRLQLCKYKRICRGKLLGNIAPTEERAIIAELASIAEREGITVEDT